MKGINLLDLVEEVKIIAVEAGQIIMEVYNHADFMVNLKADNSPLTLADKKSNDVICASLLHILPTIPIISEENKEINYAERKEYEYCWMVDPLDGTKEFIKRNGEFTVNISLLNKGEPVLGVVYVPFTRELYWATQGNGAFKYDSDQVTTLRVNNFKKTDAHLRVVCSRSHLNEETQKFIDALNKPEKVSKGSSLKFLIIAEGGAEFYPRLAPTMEWDTAAADIILKEAGGSVVNAEDKSPLAYNKENLLNPYFIASANLVS